MIGSRLGRYEIVDTLGEGGMGVVYKARDTHLDRFVAIKALPAATAAHPGRKQRFVQEARAASALNHPNIITVHDIDAAGGTDFIVMELVTGRTLTDLIPREGMPPDEALPIAIQIAGALAAAHAAGIVHRDLKPGNVMVGDDGRVRVLDFGLAKLREADSDEAVPGSAVTREATTAAAPRTEEGTILGTLNYMSPEQAEGRRVDPRSDVFSFGSVLYEMLSGRRAFPGESAASTLGAILYKEPTPVPADVPPRLRELLTRCLQKDPAQRFQRMRDLEDALAQVSDEVGAGAVRAGPAGGARLLLRPLPLLAIGLGAIAMLLIAAGWLWLERPRPGGATEPLVALPLTTYPGVEQTPALSPDGRQVAFSWNGEGQDNYDIYVQMIGTGATLRLTDDPAIDWAPMWSPDGNEIRFYRYWAEGRLAVMSVPPLPGRERTLVDNPFPPALPTAVLFFAGPAWSPDGSHTAHPSPSGLVLSGNGGVRMLGDLPGGSELFPSFAPDGRSLAFVWQPGGVDSELWSLRLGPGFQADGAPTRLTAGMRLINHPTWTPDGSEIIFSAATESGMGLWRIAASGASRPRRLVLGGGDAWSPALSRDGTRLIYEQRTDRSSIWRAPLGPDRGPAERITASTRSDGLPAYSPDGTRLAFSSTRSGSLEIWLADADGSNPVQLTSLGQYSVMPEWSPDSRSIAFQSSGDTGTDLYVVGAEGGEPRRVTTDPDHEQQPTWSPDGQSVYFMSKRSGSAEIWRVPAGGGPATQVTRDGGEFARFSPDGSELYFTRGDYGSLELWRMAAAGGAATRIEVPPIYDWGFMIVSGRLYFTRPLDGGTYPLLSLDLASGAVQEVARIGFSPFAKFSVSPDGRWVAYSEQEASDSDLMLVENFR